MDGMRNEYDPYPFTKSEPLKEAPPHSKLASSSHHQNKMD